MENLTVNTETKSTFWEKAVGKSLRWFIVVPLLLIILCLIKFISDEFMLKNYVFHHRVLLFLTSILGLYFKLIIPVGIFVVSFYYLNELISPNSQVSAIIVATIFSIFSVLGMAVILLHHMHQIGIVFVLISIVFMAAAIGVAVYTWKSNIYN